MILIADSGSTKTDWRLLQPDGTHRQFLTDGINPYYESQEAIARILTEQLRPQLPAEVPLTALYFYGAGCTGPDANESVKCALKTSLVIDGPVVVASDLLGAARATCGREPGVIAILGTGSNVSAYDGHDLTGPGLSLGFWLGDEGSGGHLGKTLVRSFLLEQLPPGLHADFQRNYPSLTRLSVLEQAYHQPFPNRWFAGFAPFLARHLAQPFVAGLVAESFRQFAVCYALRLPETHSQPLHCVGSVAEHFAPLLRQTLTEAGCRPGQIIAAPADGLVRYHTGNWPSVIGD
jgi:glucosamine kinase